MKDPLYEHLREISWRRKLTPAEQASLSAWLGAHPEAQEEWDAEAALSEALAELSNVPVASNFTARAVAAAQSHAANSERSHAQPTHWRAAWWQRWLPKSALAAVVVAAGLLCYNHVQEEHRAEIVRSLTTMSEVPALQHPELLKDFDAIAVLSPASVADEELLRVMQ